MVPIQKKPTAPKGYRLEFRTPKAGEVFFHFDTTGVDGELKEGSTLTTAVIDLLGERWVIVPEKTTVVTFEGDVSDLFQPGADGEFVVSATVLDVEVV